MVVLAGLGLGNDMVEVGAFFGQMYLVPLEGSEEERENASSRRV